VVPAAVAQVAPIAGRITNTAGKIFGRLPAAAFWCGMPGSILSFFSVLKAALQLFKLPL
jgi:hypothetical protein